MKKIILSMGIALSGMVMAQTTGHEGRVGITTTTPMATLDIAANGASKLNGILIPRVTKAQAEAMGGGTGTDELQESTLVYISDIANGATTTYTSKVDAKGFYYFDDTEWVKVGGASTSSPSTVHLSAVTENIRTVPNILSSEWKADDFTIVVTTATTVELPDPKLNKGRIIVVRNGSTAAKTYTGTWTPTNNGGLRLNAGNMLQSDGTQRWNISSF